MGTRTGTKREGMTFPERRCPARALRGAVATQVRAAQELFAIIFPAVLGVLLWGGLVLRNGRLRTLIPL